MLTIPRQHFVNKLRRLGYSFSDRTKRVELYKKPGHFVSVPTHRNLAEPTVRSILRQCGCGEAEIQSFIDSART